MALLPRVSILLPSNVRAGVFLQMITARKLLITPFARESRLASVRSKMALQLVRSRESTPALHPAAGERTLTSVPTQMRLQMRRFVVNLPASGHVTAMQRAAVRRPGQVSPGGPRWGEEESGFEAVGTVADGRPAGGRTFGC